jgi:hypothetical protein
MLLQCRLGIGWTEGYRYHLRSDVAAPASAEEKDQHDDQENRLLSRTEPIIPDGRLKARA